MKISYVIIFNNDKMIFFLGDNDSRQLDISKARTFYNYTDAENEMYSSGHYFSSNGKILQA